MECDETREFCKLLRDKYNAMVYPLIANEKAPPGWPDRYLHHAYWHGHLEFKSEHGRASKQQEIIVRDLCTRVPGSAFFVWFCSEYSLRLQWFSVGRNGWFELTCLSEPIPFLKSLAQIQSEEVHYARCKHNSPQ